MCGEGGYPQTESWGRATSGDKGLTVKVMEEEQQRQSKAVNRVKQ